MEINTKEKNIHHHAHASVKNVKIAMILNISFTVIEFVGGAITNSLAILANALHDLGDSMVLISSWKIENISLKKPDWRKTFGYRRLSLLAAFLNAVVLFGGSITILFQVIGRLISPQPVKAEGMILIAIIGVIANTIGSLKLKKGESLNEKILSWHLVEDVLSWTGILIAATIIHFTGLYILDPLVTIAFTAIVFWGVYRNSKELFNVFLEGAPSNKKLPEIVEEIENIEGVSHVYDIHLWSLDGKHHIASLKALLQKGATAKISEIEQKTKEIFSKHQISHSTIELEEKKSYRAEETEQDFLKKD